MAPVKRETQQQRAARAKHWREFRARHLLSQTALAGLLDASRRMVQTVEAAQVTPVYSILSRFAALEKKHAGERRKR